MHTPDSFTGEWLHTLLGEYPLGPRRRPVWAAAWHYSAFHTTRTTAAAAPADGEPSVAIRAIYKALVDAAPTPVPRVTAKHPEVNWPRVWANVHHKGLQEDVAESWWLAVHDLTATRSRQHRIGRTETDECPECGGQDTLAHRVTGCTKVTMAWRWTRAVLTKALGTTATSGTLLQPDFDAGVPERQATAVSTLR